VGRDTAVYAAPITVTATPDGQSFVVEQGLKAGQEVVVEGAASLKDGTKIKPVVQSPAKAKTELKG
jgi:membrane fusion protein (multidrug efflux system)